MENKITDKEKVKDLKVKDDTDDNRMGNYGENKEAIKPDAKITSNHIPYDPKIDTRNAQNTVSPR